MNLLSDIKIHEMFGNRKHVLMLFVNSIFIMNVSQDNLALFGSTLNQINIHFLCMYIYIIRHGILETIILFYHYQNPNCQILLQ